MVTALCTITDVDNLFQGQLPSSITDALKTNFINTWSIHIKSKLGEEASTSNENAVQCCAFYSAASIALIVYPLDSTLHDNYANLADKLLDGLITDKAGSTFGSS